MIDRPYLDETTHQLLGVFEAGYSDGLFRVERVFETSFWQALTELEHRAGDGDGDVRTCLYRRRVLLARGLERLDGLGIDAELRDEIRLELEEPDDLRRYRFAGYEAVTPGSAEAPPLRAVEGEG